MRGFRLPQSFAAVSLVVGLSVLSEGCGGSSGPTTPTVTTPQPVVMNYTYTIPSKTHWYHNFQTTRTGKMTVTVRWNDGAKDLDLYLTLQGCNYWESQCASSLVGRSEEPTGIQEQVTLAVSSGVGYTFWVLNYGAASEDARVEVRIE